MNEQELNRKLAEWAGLKCLSCGQPVLPKSAAKPGYRPAMCCCHTLELPNFTQSLDACFKWLVPKLQKQGFFCSVGAWECSGFWAIAAEAFNSEPEQIKEEHSPALALCLAIEKLIDSESK